MLINRQGVEEGQSLNEYLIEKFITHSKWINEACNNINNANLYWAERRKEKLSMNNKHEIKVGDLVKVRNFSRTKLQPYFLGPFKVVKTKFNTVTLEDVNTGEQLKRNVHIKKYCQI